MGSCLLESPYVRARRDSRLIRRFVDCINFVALWTKQLKKTGRIVRRCPSLLADAAVATLLYSRHLVPILVTGFADFDLRQRKLVTPVRRKASAESS